MPERAIEAVYAVAAYHDNFVVGHQYMDFYN